MIYRGTKPMSFATIKLEETAISLFGQKAITVCPFPLLAGSCADIQLVYG